jgi:AcrR family transcriptional regulator
MARPVQKLNDIERTAIRLFASRGVTGITIKDIASEAGCAEGALYRHFSGKEDLAWRLFQREVESFGSRVRALWKGPSSIVKKLEDGIEFFYRFFDEDPDLFSFILLSQHNFAVQKRLKKELNPETLVFEFVEEAKRSGQFKIEDARLCAAMLYGLVLEPATLVAEKKLKGPLSRYIPEVTKGALRLLGAKSRLKPAAPDAG